MQSVITPPLPMPQRTRPNMKTAKLGASEVMIAPREKKSEEERIISPGEKIMDSRPMSGAVEDMEIK